MVDRRRAGATKARWADALISVTSFFRNAEAFEALKRKVFSRLLQERGDEPTVAGIDAALLHEPEGILGHHDGRIH